MSMEKLVLPEHYVSKLDVIQTEVAIKLVKDTFERELAAALRLTRVSAPLFVRPESGSGGAQPGKMETPGPEAVWLCPGRGTLCRHERHSPRRRFG